MILAKSIVCAENQPRRGDMIKIFEYGIVEYDSRPRIAGIIQAIQTGISHCIRFQNPSEVGYTLL